MLAMRTTVSRRWPRWLMVGVLVLGAAGALAGAVRAAAPATGTPRVFSIAGGKVTVEGTKGHETVTIARKGAPVTESVCDARAGTYDDLTALFKKVKAAVKGGRPAAVMPLLHFPFRLNVVPLKTYADAAELTAHYAEVFTPAIVKRVQAAEPAAIYCSGGAAMLGDGVIWGHTDDHGFTAADVVNP